MDPHRLAEVRSLVLHRRIAERLRQRPELRAVALRRVLQWCETGAVHAHYARRWRQLLEGSVEQLCALLVDPGEEAMALRQVTPFAGVIPARERWRIWREVRQQVEGKAAS